MAAGDGQDRRALVAPDEALRWAARLIKGPVVVHLCHRASLPRHWATCHDGRPPTAAPYAFRAWAQAQRGACWLLVDPTETRASATWLLFHELGHLALPAAVTLAALGAVTLAALGAVTLAALGAIT